MDKNYKIYLNSSAKNIDELFLLLSTYALRENIVDNRNYFLKALRERELSGSTGLENGIAIPHGISDKIKKHFIFFVTLQNSIKWKTFDDSNVKTIICFAVPKNAEENHLQVLQNVSIMLMDEKNQNLLNSGNLTEIDSLFSKIVIDEQINKNKNMERKSRICNQDIEEKDDNLIYLKNKLTKKYLISRNKSIYNEIKKIDEEIGDCKANIKKIKINHRISKLELLKKFKKNNSLIKFKIQKERKFSNEKLELFKIRNTKRKKIIINNPNKNEKDSLLDFNYKTYIEKNKIIENLNKYKLEKQEINRNFKDDKEKLRKDFLIQLKYNRYKFVNPKNFLYINGNKIQLALMIILAVIGLWAIVLGSIGVGTFGDFIKSDVNLWSGLGVVGFDEQALKDWSSNIIANNILIAISAIVLGVLSFLLIIPMKFFKIQEVVHEGISISISVISTILIAASLVMVILSLDNINIFESNSILAITLNEDFSNALILSEELRTIEDFNGSEVDFELYVERIQALFRLYGLKDDTYTSENRILALAEAKLQASEDFNNIILNPTNFSSIFNNLLVLK